MKHLNLVPFTEEFLNKSFTWCNDIEIQKLTDGKSVTREEQRVWFEQLKTKQDYRIWGISCDGTPIGACGYKRISGDYGEYWGYVGEKEYWGGIGHQLMSLMEIKAKELHLSVIALHVLQTNARAIHLYENEGFILISQNERLRYYEKKLIDVR